MNDKRWRMGAQVATTCTRPAGTRAPIQQLHERKRPYSDHTGNRPEHVPVQQPLRVRGRHGSFNDHKDKKNKFEVLKDLETHCHRTGLFVTDKCTPVSRASDGEPRGQDHVATGRTHRGGGPHPEQGFATTDQTFKLDQLMPNFPALLPQLVITDCQAVDREPGVCNTVPPDSRSAAAAGESCGTSTGTQGNELRTAAATARAALPILLFDLNGTLTSHTSQRYSSGITRVRPGVKFLTRLANKCRLGIFSSATHRTVTEARALLEQAADNTPLFEPGLILHRGHTVPTPNAAGKQWDTAKPLSHWFSRLDRVLLFDDDEHKSLPAERDSLVHVPVWRESSTTCPVLHELVSAVEEVLDQLAQDADIRTYVPAINARLQAAAITANPSDDDAKHDADASYISNIDPSEIALD